MSDEIKIHVVAWSNRPRYQLQWIDPLTSKKKTKSSTVARPADDAGKRDRKKALDAAAVEAAALAAKLAAGDFRQSSDRATWADFRERYEREGLGGKAARTIDKVATVFNSIENHLDPKFLDALDASQIGKFAQALRVDKKSPSQRRRSKAVSHTSRRRSAGRPASRCFTRFRESRCRRQPGP